VVSKRDLHELNRRSWNEATRAHQSHKRDQARFLREGGSTLFPEERELAGDVRGLRLLHLQCNAGQDTLSFAALGADVTGVDISDAAIAEARSLADASGIPGRFERADVYEWLASAAAAGERFDLAFSSYGFLLWLSDLASWARGVAAVLRPGGRLVLVEFHPVAMLFDEDGALRYPYSTRGEVILESPGVSDYVGQSGELLAPSGFIDGEPGFVNPHACACFQWGLGDLVTALLDAGLALEALREYPYANGCRLWRSMRELEGRRLVLDDGKPELPLMFGLTARRPTD
jgi:SAM-dependent methyltransferase